VNQRTRSDPTKRVENSFPCRDLRRSKIPSFYVAHACSRAAGTDRACDLGPRQGAWAGTSSSMLGQEAIDATPLARDRPSQHIRRTADDLRALVTIRPSTLVRWTLRGRHQSTLVRSHRCANRRDANHLFGRMDVSNFCWRYRYADIGISTNCRRRYDDVGGLRHAPRATSRRRQPAVRFVLLDVAARSCDCHHLPFLPAPAYISDTTRHGRSVWMNARGQGRLIRPDPADEWEVIAMPSSVK